MGHGWLQAQQQQQQQEQTLPKCAVRMYKIIIMTKNMTTKQRGASWVRALFRQVCPIRESCDSASSLSLCRPSGQETQSHQSRTTKTHTPDTSECVARKQQAIATAVLVLPVRSGVPFFLTAQTSFRPHVPRTKKDKPKISCVSCLCAQHNCVFCVSSEPAQATSSPYSSSL